jgi:hypothetical protein
LSVFVHALVAATSFQLCRFDLANLIKDEIGSKVVPYMQSCRTRLGTLPNFCDLTSLRGAKVLKSLGHAGGRSLLRASGTSNMRII